jgi:hypothetical protein
LIAPALKYSEEDEEDIVKQYSTGGKTKKDLVSTDCCFRRK